MQDSPTVQTPLQPFINLVQKNMALLTQLSLSPEAVSQAMANAQSLLQREPGAAANVAQSNVFGELMQGMLRNYAEFLAEVSQNGMALMAQTQAAALQKAEEQASEGGAAATRARGRRSR